MLLLINWVVDKLNQSLTVADGEVYRLYLGPMSAPDQLGSDKFKPIVVLGRELLPAPAFSPVYWAFFLCWNEKWIS
jgi:hypothetical protein